MSTAVHAGPLVTHKPLQPAANQVDSPGPGGTPPDRLMLDQCWTEAFGQLRLVEEL